MTYTMSGPLRFGDFVSFCICFLLFVFMGGVWVLGGFINDECDAWVISETLIYMYILHIPY